ncbi:hypothetical protein [Paraburkholderia gardini]|uniref:Uncharacterized protein n=1 Tax=Paraburkholderia gardini TaxID=2823469 RepID=A0ABN7QVU5_9BURK|nr:hypothetical protein [Paraburkholderia gardini]CAG4921032.1 hypothetical protein R54767_04773 [Paraburkholderia gardini]
MDDDRVLTLRQVAYWREKLAGRSVRPLTADAIVDVLPAHQSVKGKP